METNNVTQNLTDKLKTIRKPKSWAARKLNVSYGHLHCVLSGKRILSDGLREKIEDLLNKIESPVAS